MKKEIIIYEEDKENLKFLRAFFREKGDYSTRFIEKRHEDIKERTCREKACCTDC